MSEPEIQTSSSNINIWLPQTIDIPIIKHHYPQIKKLKSAGTKTKRNEPLNKTDSVPHRHAATTIFFLSVIFTVSNTTTVVIWTSVYHDILHQNKTKHIEWYQLILIYFSGTVMFQVASLISAIVIVQRGQSQLRGYFTKFVKSFTELRMGSNERSNKILMRWTW